MRSIPIAVAALGVIAACRAASAPVADAGAPAPEAAVERFLQLAAQKDYRQMGWLFGTERGSIYARDSRENVEKRMYILATVLEHESYRRGEAQPVPGRPTAQRYDVVVRQRGRDYTVPFVVVRGPRQRWFVAQIGLEAITNPRP